MGHCGTTCDGLWQETTSWDMLLSSPWSGYTAHWQRRDSSPDGPGALQKGHRFGFLCGLIEVTLLRSTHRHRLRNFFSRFPVSALICMTFEFPCVSCVFLLFSIPGGVALFFGRLSLAFSWALLVWLDLNSCLLPSDSVCLCCTVLHCVAPLSSDLTLTLPASTKAVWFWINIAEPRFL